MGIFGAKNKPLTTLTAADFDGLDESRLGLKGSPTQPGEYRNVAHSRTCKEWNSVAQLLKGSLCYTRPVVDMGYTGSEDAMVGTSGKMIRPKLCIGFGVSGASHHVCGMKDSGTIISINTNEKAEIFNVSDYKLIGDSGAVLDELLELLKTQ